ncbi:MAG: SO_0444 family Cu/Zn efflux transporter [Bacteroidales bacterium]|nr:MAG: SO_0444 family Cu/Zn efflux transporter [Bacteroidales bacterium]
MNYLFDFLSDLVDIVNEMSPYLMLGFLFAGILHVFFPKRKVNKYMGGNNASAVINSAMIGIPLPLCSCGVIPAGISFYKHGASKGSTVSFLISTPQTGIDSIMVTYSLLGLPFALIRPVIALITGFFGGFLTNISNSRSGAISRDEILSNDASDENGYEGEKIREVFRYAYIEFLQDISKYLVIGLILATVISVLIPDDFFTEFLGNDFWSMLIILIAAVPVYLCATASVPVAAILMLKGLSPGAALVLLMAGPATNAATITLIKNELGLRPLLAYLSTIITGALIFGTLINSLLPASWFTIPDIVSPGMDHEHGILPNWLKAGSSIVLVLLILFGYLQKYLKSRKIPGMIPANPISPNLKKMISKKIMVKGMTCNHCRQNVENNIKSVEGIKEVRADISSGTVLIQGDRIDLDKIRNAVEQSGYEFAGETK